MAITYCRYWIAVSGRTAIQRPAAKQRMPASRLPQVLRTRSAFAMIKEKI